MCYISSIGLQQLNKAPFIEIDKETTVFIAGIVDRKLQSSDDFLDKAYQVSVMPIDPTLPGCYNLGLRLSRRNKDFYNFPTCTIPSRKSKH